MLQRNKKATPSPTRGLQPPDRNYNNDEEDEVVDPTQIYRDACKKANKNPLPQILQGMNDFELSLKVEFLTTQELPPIKTLLQKYYFPKLSIYSDIEEPEDLDQRSQSRSRMFNKSSYMSTGSNKRDRSNLRSANTPKSQEKNKASKTKSKAFLDNLAKVLCSHLLKTDKLEVFVITGVQFSKDAWSNLGKGIKDNKTIKELYINHCDFTSQDLEILYPTFSANTKLNLIDLSNNKLDNDCGRMLGSVIGAHSQRRDEIVWVYSIRGDQPEEDVDLKGLCDLNVSYNQLESPAIKDLCNHLKYDTWLRNLNLRGNRIDDQGVRALLEVVRNNTSLFSLDLRDNSFFDGRASKEILIKLSENIMNYKQKNMIVTLEDGQTEESEPQGAVIYRGQPREITNETGGEYYDHAQGEEQYPYEEGNHPGVDYESRINHEEVDELIKKYEANSPITEEEYVTQEDNNNNHHNNNLESMSFGFKNNKIKERMENYKAMRPHLAQSDGVVNKKFHSHQKDRRVREEPEEEEVDKETDIYAYCKQLEKKVLVSESKIVNLLLENYKLKRALNSALQAQSISAITPENDANPNFQQELSQDLFKRVPTGELNLDGEDLLGRIEYLMGELTRMMDNLENANVTNNFTGHFTNSTSQTNNVTYQLINSANNIKFDSTYTNILNSNNNSRLNQPGSQLGQASTQNPLRDNSKSFSRSSKMKGRNPSEPLDQSSHNKSDNERGTSHYSMLFKNESSQHNEY